MIGFNIIKHEAEGQVIERIFTLYAGGTSVNEIVRTLNSENIPWPGANTGFAKTRKGWAHSSVVSLLDSEKYAGSWSFGRRKWFKDAVSGKRRYREVPEGEWSRKERPDLAIVSRELWEAAQSRRAHDR